METQNQRGETETRVLVVAAGLGMNAGTGLEAPLAFGKYVSNGIGGVLEITPEQRSARAATSANFIGFMGEKFTYKWERDWMYKGDAGFSVASLLRDRSVHIDVVQHPFNLADQESVLAQALPGAYPTNDPGDLHCAVNDRLEQEKKDMWNSFSETHATSISTLLQLFEYHVLLCGSKGLAMVARALEMLPKGSRIAAVVVNGAEYHIPEYTSAVDNPDQASKSDIRAIMTGSVPSTQADRLGFERHSASVSHSKGSTGSASLPPGDEGIKFVGHPSVSRLVLTSHGGITSRTLRQAVIKVNQDFRKTNVEHGRKQQLVIYSILDHRIVPNRESHSHQWSMSYPEECWFPGYGKPPQMVLADGQVCPGQSSSGIKLPPLARLVRWAAAREDGMQESSNPVSVLSQIRQFPGPRRYAEIRVEHAQLGYGIDDHALFQPLQLNQCVAEATPGQYTLAVDNVEASQSNPALHASVMFFDEQEPVHDIFFDSRVDELQVVLKDARSGKQTSVQEILETEGQYATRLVRFFRNYDERSVDILASLNSQQEDNTLDRPRLSADLAAEIMLGELLGLNRNFGNFLWTCFMVPYTAYQPKTKWRFGADLIELVIKIEVARLGASYLGFAKGSIDAEHIIQGHHSAYGDALDDYLATKAKQLRQKRRQAFLSNLDFDHNMSKKTQEFDRSEEVVFRTHGLVHIEGYVRREFTIGNMIALEDVQRELAEYPSKVGLADAPAYHFSDYGHSSSFRFFPNGVTWLATSCEAEDIAFVKELVATHVLMRDGSVNRESPLLSLLTEHKQTSVEGNLRSYWRLPSGVIPPAFLRRNGYQVVAYRKYGDAGMHFNSVAGGWRSFSGDMARKGEELARRFRFKYFGDAEPKTNTFGQVDKLPEEIGRGGTTAKLYFYDTEFKSRQDEQAKVVLDGVNRNRVKWWELELYALTPRDLRGKNSSEDWLTYWCSNDSLNFASELARLRMSMRKELELYILEVRNLSEGPAFERIEAIQSSYSILKAILCTIESGLTDDNKTYFCKDEAVDWMNMGLRWCPRLPIIKRDPVLKAVVEIRHTILGRLEAACREAGLADDEVHIRRLAQAIQTDNAFSALQEEVTVVMDSFESCS